MGVVTYLVVTAAARPIIWQTRIFRFTLYQLSWTWNGPQLFFLFGQML